MLMPSARMAGIGALVAALSSCTGVVYLHPDGSPGPQECPSEAKRMMEALDLRVGDSGDVELDLNQNGYGPITLYDGPIESMVRGSFGTLDSGDRLYGRVWTGGSNVIIRYYEAQRHRGQPIPICAVARLGDNQLRKLPESKPGMAVLPFSRAAVYVVSEFR